MIWIFLLWLEWSSFPCSNPCSSNEESHITSEGLRPGLIPTLSEWFHPLLTPSSLTGSSGDRALARQGDWREVGGVERKCHFLTAAGTGASCPWSVRQRWLTSIGRMFFTHFDGNLWLHYRLLLTSASFLECVCQRLVASLWLKEQRCFGQEKLKTVWRSFMHLTDNCFYVSSYWILTVFYC